MSFSTRFINIQTSKRTGSFLYRLANTKATVQPEDTSDDSQLRQSVVISY